MILKICKSRENCEEKGKERIPNIFRYEVEFLLVLLFDCFWAAEVLLFYLFQGKRFLECWFFDIPAAVKGTAGRLTRIG